MIVPEFWAEARIQKRLPDRQITVRRFGWSDLSQQDAQKHADTRVADAIEKILRGEQLPRREKKVRYNGADGLPIREEIVDRLNDNVITRNSYGARCLNSPDVFFADVDYPGSRYNSLSSCMVDTGIAAVVAIAVGVWLQNLWMGLVVLPATLAFIALSMHWFNVLSIKLHGGKEQIAIQKIDTFAGAHRDWHLRIYRTPNGYRVLAMHATFDPRSEQVESAFASLGVDPTYALMCQKQNCFRARLTAKPWRIGIDSHLKPRPGVWPIDESQMPQRNLWIQEYESNAANYAACEFVKATGPTQLLTTKTRIVSEYHDEVCRAKDQLPLA